MARRNHRKSAPAGCGKNAGRGLSALAKQDAIVRQQRQKRSVPQLQWDREGVAVIENPTVDQVEGVRLLGAGKWTWNLESDRLVVIHLAKSRAYEDRQYKLDLVGWIDFKRGFATVECESEEHYDALIDVARMKGWTISPMDEHGRVHIQKRKAA